jgi:uncharacterized protein (DUF488 family)
MSEKSIFTIGHSTHSLAELTALLHRHRLTHVVDVRKLPKSRRLPQFDKDALSRSLPARGVAYTHMGELGGFRRPRPDSPNAGWRSGGFRAYADYMLTEQFVSALDRVEQLARSDRTAIMCAEGLWWRCHRRLIADALSVRGWRVSHVLPDGGLAEHSLPEFALVDGERIKYPPLLGSLGSISESQSS